MWFWSGSSTALPGNRYDAVNYKHQLEKNGVHLVSAMEPISQGPEGIMVESMLIGMAEYYSAELS